LFAEHDTLRDAMRRIRKGNWAHTLNFVVGGIAVVILVIVISVKIWRGDKTAYDRLIEDVKTGAAKTLAEDSNKLVLGSIDRGDDPEYVQRELVRLNDQKVLAELLERAVLKNRPGVVGVLLEAKADPNTRLGDGATLLHVSALKGHPDIVRKLIEAGVGVNARTVSGYTPTHMAAMREDGQGLTVARILCGTGADLGLVANDGRSPLQIALDRKNTSLALMLMEQMNSFTERGPRPGTAPTTGQRP
jgi:hypothetical protein